MIEAEKAEIEKQRWIAASYTAWQMGAGKNMSFPMYLKHLGLSDKEPELTSEQKKIIIAKADAVAERINAAMRAGSFA